MVNPVRYTLNNVDGNRLLYIEPVLEEITGGDLFSTGRYILSENDISIGEIRLFYDEYFETDWYGNGNAIKDNDLLKLTKFIKEYNEPDLVDDFD